MRRDQHIFGQTLLNASRSTSFLGGKSICEHKAMSSQFVDGYDGQKPCQLNSLIAMIARNHVGLMFDSYVHQKPCQLSLVQETDGANLFMTCVHFGIGCGAGYTANAQIGNSMMHWSSYAEGVCTSRWRCSPCKIQGHRDSVLDGLMPCLLDSAQYVNGVNVDGWTYGADSRDGRGRTGRTWLSNALNLCSILYKWSCKFVYCYP